MNRYNTTRKDWQKNEEKIKIFFFFFYPHTLTFRLKRPVYRGFSGEGKCEGVRVKCESVRVKVWRQGKDEKQTLCLQCNINYVADNFSYKRTA